MKLTGLLCCVVACGSGTSSQPASHPPAYVAPPIRPGVPPPADEAGFRALLAGDLAYGGLWFADPSCQAQFGAPGTIHPAAFEAFARCAAGLHLHPTGREDTFDDTSVLTDDVGFEIEARVAKGRLDYIGFSARSPNWSEEPSITPTTLESLRASGDANATVTPDVGNRLIMPKRSNVTASLRLCLADDGRITTISPASSMLPAALSAFSAVVRTWTFHPFMAAGKPIAACAIVGFQFPAEPRVKERELLPRPPHFSKAGHVFFNVNPTEFDTLRIGGDKYILPYDSDKWRVREMGRPVIGSYKLCIDETGHYAQGIQLKSTGLPTYDQKIERTMMTEWVFRPYIVDGEAIPVCTAFTFIFTAR